MCNHATRVGFEHNGFFSSVPSTFDLVLRVSALVCVLLRIFISFGSTLQSNMDDFYDPAWPPGTVRLQQLFDNESKDAEIILQPRPTDNPSEECSISRC